MLIQERLTLLVLNLLHERCRLLEEGFLKSNQDFGYSKYLFRGVEVIELFVYCTNLKSLPNRSSLKKIMWSGAKSISHAFDLKEFNILMLSWDKWIDDERWNKNLKKPFEHINFEIIDKNIVLIDIEDDALFVDKRAFYLGAIYICEKTNGQMSDDKVNWNTPGEFTIKISDFINCSFKDAIEFSYKEARL